MKAPEAARSKVARGSAWSDGSKQTLMLHTLHVSFAIEFGPQACLPARLRCLRLTNNRTGAQAIVRIVDMCGHSGEPTACWCLFSAKASLQAADIKAGSMPSSVCSLTPRPHATLSPPTRAPACALQPLTLTTRRHSSLWIPTVTDTWMARSTSQSRSSSVEDLRPDATRRMLICRSCVICSTLY